VTDDPALGIALTTVRAERTSALLSAVLGESTRPGFVSVTYQGSHEEGDALRDRLAALAAESDYEGLIFCRTSGRGASRGRNEAFRALPESVVWVWTPNDTSLPPADWAHALGRCVDQVDESVAAVAMDYHVGDVSRRQVSDMPMLSGWSLWRAIEPAVAWRRRTVIDLGGFDENIGTGAHSWAQSGEGTDLLLRMQERGYDVVTTPLVVTGAPQHLSSVRRDRRRKEFYYGVGFGCVARRHFSVARCLPSVVGPLLRLLRGQPVEGQRLSVWMSLTACTGRAVGLLMGERAVRRTRLPGGHWA
jgi:hypothetical protein